MGRISATPNLIKKLLFIQKHSNKVLISPNGISTRYITVQSVGFSDCTFGIETKELIEMLKHTEEFEIIENNKLEYRYKIHVGIHEGEVCKNIPLFELSYLFNFNTSICTLKLPHFKSITNDETNIEFINGMLICESKGYVQTRIIFDVQRVEGSMYFNIKTRGCDLKIIEDIEGDRVLCYFENSLVVFGFEEGINTAAVIKCIV